MQWFLNLINIFYSHWNQVNLFKLRMLNLSNVKLFFNVILNLMMMTRQKSEKVRQNAVKVVQINS